jgi:hypothetical protein
MSEACPPGARSLGKAPPPTSLSLSTPLWRTSGPLSGPTAITVDAPVRISFSLFLHFLLWVSSKPIKNDKKYLYMYFFFYLGWGNHFVSKRNYHLIIPAADEWNKPLADDFVDLHTHLLHGLLHCNGFGHLLCINGIAGGSKYLCGRQLMDLWDRICTNLRIRLVKAPNSLVSFRFMNIKDLKFMRFFALLQENHSSGFFKEEVHGS